MTSFLYLQELGQGAFGKVYKAKTPSSHPFAQKHPLVAIKSLTAENAADCDNEVRILQGLKNDNIIRYLHHFRDRENNLQIVMEFCDYGSLENYVKKHGDVSENSKVWRVIKQIALGLDYLHCQRPPIIHCDLKPENLLLKKRGDDSLQIKIADFGISKILGKKSLNSEMYYTHQVNGTRIYMAPEALRSGFDHNSRVGVSADIWSFGAIISFICNRKHLFRTKHEVLNWRFADPRALMNKYEFSTDLWQLTADMLNPNHTYRPTAGRVKEEAEKQNRHQRPREDLRRKERERIGISLGNEQINREKHAQQTVYVDRQQWWELNRLNQKNLMYENYNWRQQSYSNELNQDRKRNQELEKQRMTYDDRRQWRKSNAYELSFLNQHNPTRYNLCRQSYSNESDQERESNQELQRIEYAIRQCNDELDEMLLDFESWGL